MKRKLHIKILICAMLLIMTESTFSQATILKDIYLGPLSSMENFSPTKIGDKLIFSANDGVHGSEGWLTDGTTSGTIRMIENTVNFIDTLYTISYGNGLYKTNGTEVNYVFSNLGFTGVSRVTKVNETWFFVANINSNNREELWKSDGTEAGTVVVKKFRPNSYDYAWTSNLIASSDETTLYFTADDGPGIALWRSDGTTEGTLKIKSFANSRQHEIGSFVNYNNQTFFWAKNPSGYLSLWKTDGTTAGTVVVYDKVSCRLSVGNVIVYKNKIYFNGQNQEPPYTFGEELWVSDGTTGGTHLFFDTSTGEAHGTPTGFQIVNNLLIFLATTNLNGKELWVSNGNTNGTFILKDVYPGTASGFLAGSHIKELNKLFFTGDDGNQRMLWETDGTVAGTIPLYDISESDLPMFTLAGYINNKLIFLKETIANGKELWSSDIELSVDAFEKNEKIYIYPNPVSNNLTITAPFTGNIQLKVINYLGQIVLEQNQNTSSIELDVSKLSKGLYYVKMTSKYGNSQTIKFIKN